VKLMTFTQVTVDGVVQGNGGRDENRSGGFERGGWARTVFDEQAMALVDQTYRRADAFLFGRRTYELFARYWGAKAPGTSPIADALRSRPKFVASTTLTDPQWTGSTLLSGDLASALRDLKAAPGGELQVHGSGTLVRWLLANDLVDELTLLVCPVIVGQGLRLFPQDGPDLALELIDSQSFPKGVAVLTYRPGGRPEYAA